MDIEVVKRNIVKWIDEFVTVSNKKLNNWQPCPFARKTLIQQKYDIRIGTDVATDCEQCATEWNDKYEVVIYAYEREQYTPDNLGSVISDINTRYNSKDLLFLEDHPDDKEIVNGVCFNQGQYTLVLIQRLSTVVSASLELQELGYYKLWPKDYFDKVAGWREQSGFDDN